MANETDLQRVQTVLGYRFHNVGQLEEALTAAHRIEFDNGIYESYENNKRFAALGEATIKLVITENWFNTDDRRSKTDRRKLG
jgi:dsRNA-specific ribonuclease